MKVTSKFTSVFAKMSAAAGALLMTSMAAHATNWEATGPSVGKISQNIASSLSGVASGFEAFLYLLGFVFLVLFLLAAWKYKKSEGRDGNMGLIVTYLVLAVAAFAAPTVLGSGMATLFGDTSVNRVTAPTPSFTN
jgi:phosphoglycerol transferase MdoB-like AlkP superfamily enzyme